MLLFRSLIRWSSFAMSEWPTKCLIITWHAVLCLPPKRHPKGRRSSESLNSQKMRRAAWSELDARKSCSNEEWLLCYSSEGLSCCPIDRFRGFVFGLNICTWRHEIDTKLLPKNLSHSTPERLVLAEETRLEERFITQHSSVECGLISVVHLSPNAIRTNWEQDRARGGRSIRIGFMLKITICWLLCHVLSELMDSSVCFPSDRLLPMEISGRRVAQEDHYRFMKEVMLSALC